VVVNPWNTLYAWAESLYRRVHPNGSLSLYRPYPLGWGVWPAMILFVGFAWFELAYPTPALPIKIATATLVYSMITWLGMAVYGRAVWLRNGEAFSVVFGLLAKFSPSECRVSDTSHCKVCSLRCESRADYCADCYECFSKASRATRRIDIRAYGSGLLTTSHASNSMTIFIILLLSTVTYDGLMATPLWRDVYAPLFRNLHDPALVNTIGLVLCPIVLILGYFGTVELMNRIVPTQNVVLAQTFVFSLVPIALAYHICPLLLFPTDSRTTDHFVTIRSFWFWLGYY
jgi:predicted nucleic acid-binding Zn ribbon protein